MLSCTSSGFSQGLIVEEEEILYNTGPSFMLTDEMRLGSAQPQPRLPSCLPSRDVRLRGWETAPVSEKKRAGGQTKSSHLAVLREDGTHMHLNAFSVAPIGGRRPWLSGWNHQCDLSGV
jgi:hypothetical protein